MAFEEDFTLFFDVVDGFAVDASWTAAGQVESLPGEVIFSADGAVVDDFSVAVEGPSAVLPAPQWPGIDEGDAVAIGSCNYLVRQVLVLGDGGLKRLVFART